MPLLSPHTPHSTPRILPPQTGEQALIDWLRHRLPAHLQLLVGPGDDAASLRLSPHRQCLLTTDLMMEGVHFDLSSTSAARVGRKALAINLSDIAAMAGRPVAALVSVALPRAGGGHLAQELLTGMQELAEEFHVAMAGGDTNSWDGPLVVSVTLLGEAHPKGPLLRSGAKPGDWVLVSGSFGGSLAGKHLNFQPRVREAYLLHDRYKLHAMIDVSDGLSTDLTHILEESGCGAVLHAKAIPISEVVEKLDDGISALDHALNDGEDFELLFTAPPQEAQRMLEDQPLDLSLTHIGEITTEPDAWLIDPNGRRVPLKPEGWEHIFSPADSPAS